MPETNTEKKPPAMPDEPKPKKSCFQRLASKFDKWLLLSVFIGCALTMPFNGIPAASEFWKYLYGNEYFGIINWCGAIPAPFVTLLMVKIEHLVSIKKRLLGCWATSIITLSTTVGISNYYSLNRLKISFEAIFSIFCSIVIFNAIAFAVSQASFFSFLSLFEPKFIQSLPTGMSISSLFLALYWLLLASLIDYTKNSLLILTLFYGLIMVFLIASIFVFLYILNHRHLRNISRVDSRESFSFNELNAVYRKLWEFSLLLFWLIYVNVLLAPTLCFGFKASSPSIKHWGSALLLADSAAKMVARILSHHKIPGFDIFFSPKRIKYTILTSTVFFAAVLLPIWLLQTGNITSIEDIPRNVWIDVVVTAMYISKSSFQGYAFNILMKYGLHRCEDKEKQRGALMMSVSFLAGNFMGQLSSFLLNLLNKTR